jgi:plastocyanin
MRVRFPLAVAAGVTIALTGVAWAAPTAVVIDDNSFNPAEPPAQDFGDGGFEFDWLATTNSHNVRQDKRLFRSGDPTTSGTFSLTDISAGTFPYHCEVHGDEGMRGILRVRPAQLATKAKRGEIQIGVGWADLSLQTGDRFDVQFRVNTGDWKSWKQDTSQVEGTFGKNGKPVEVKPGKTYRFRVRSELAAHPSRASEFSPPLKVIEP